MTFTVVCRTQSINHLRIKEPERWGPTRKRCCLHTIVTFFAYCDAAAAALLLLMDELLMDENLTSYKMRSLLCQQSKTATGKCADIFVSVSEFISLGWFRLHSIRVEGIRDRMYMKPIKTNTFAFFSQLRLHFNSKYSIFQGNLKD